MLIFTRFYFGRPLLSRPILLQQEAMNRFNSRLIFTLFFLMAALATNGCSLMSLGDNLSTAVLEQNDPELVRAGLPSYLLMVDGLIATDPRNAGRLRSGADLYAFYTASFVENPERAKRLADKAFAYAGDALCREENDACCLRTLPVEEMSAVLEHMDAGALPYLMTYGTGWLLWIRQHADNWGALADLPKVELLLKRMLALDEGYQEGRSHFYLGILQSLRPAALGGDPESGRRHFERAIALAGGRDLSYQVEFAAVYARAVYDRDLHDRLLNEVLAADPQAPGRTLTNLLARQRAEALLASADDYF